MGDFYGTGIEIWAGFGPIDSTEKRAWTNYEQLLRMVFSCLGAKKNFQIFSKNIVAFFFFLKRIKKHLDFL